ncbi:Npt1/Npt2 family nucleotide transporter [Rhodohalobacter sp. 8-1]|uniref:Npt1/Npt2 family nucleotide transporter n=1 Tax=Rhodohalobacter sp. 8-1 TaxID=3131972 RepID=UPI0030EC77FA
MKKLVSIFYDVRENEWKPVFLMVGLHFLLMVVLYFLKPARDSLFLVETGPDQLPIVYIVLALVSLPITYLVSDVLARFPTRQVIGYVLGFLTLNLMLLRWLFLFDHPLIYMAFYIWVGIFGILVISLFWLLANSIFDAAQSKRLFSLLTLAAIVGSIFGSQASSLVVSYTPVITEDLLYISIGILCFAVLILYFIPGVNSENDRKGRPESRITGNDKTPSAVKTVVGSKYQLLIAGIIGLTTIATTFTDYQFKALSFNAYPETENLTAFIGTFYAGISLASLGIQVLFSSGIIKKFGVAGAVLTRPLGMMLGGLLMAVEPVLASVVLLNGFDSATRYSIDKTGRELLFLPLSQHIKERTKLFIDLFVDRFSRGLSGAILLLLLYMMETPITLITIILLFTIACWIFLGYRAKKEYIDTFRTSLQRMLVDTDSIELDLNEPVILKLIKESLQSGNDNQVLHTLILLENTDVEPVAGELRVLLNHPNTEIRLNALKLLQSVESVHWLEDVKNLLNDDSPEIRVETIYYLCIHSNDDPSSVIQSYLKTNQPQMQSAALGCTCKHGEQDDDGPDPKLFDDIMNNLPDDEKEQVVIKAQLADALGFVKSRSLASRHLSNLIQDSNRTVVTKALQSIAKLKLDRMVPDLLQMLNTKKFTPEVRETLGSYGNDYLTLYKSKFLDASLPLMVRKQIPGIFYHRPNETSMRHLEDMIEADEPDLRYHVIKTLNKIHREYPGLEPNRERVYSCLRSESGNYFNLLAIKAIQPESRPNSILLKALSEKMDQTLERMFRLLGLIYNQKDLYSSYLALKSISRDKRSAAVEFIDNILDPKDHKLVFPIVDDISEEKKMETGYELFNIEKVKYDQALIKLFNGNDRWLKTCAIYSVSPVCPATLQERVETYTKSDDPLYRETARMVKQRNQRYNGSEKQANENHQQS